MMQRGTIEYQKPRCSTLLTADQGNDEYLAMDDSYTWREKAKTEPCKNNIFRPSESRRSKKGSENVPWILVHRRA
jgi:hypothetical protein